MLLIKPAQHVFNCLCSFQFLTRQAMFSDGNLHETSRALREQKSRLLVSGIAFRPVEVYLALEASSCCQAPPDLSHTWPQMK
jgi:hypothetical protein